MRVADHLSSVSVDFKRIVLLIIVLHYFLLGLFTAASKAISICLTAHNLPPTDGENKNVETRYNSVNTAKYHHL